MSADNWTTCPKCAVIAKEAADKKMKQAEAMYGKIPADEYLKLIQKASSEEPNKPETSLREDYELGIVGNEFYIRYSAYCTECKYKFNYSVDQKLDL